MRSIICYLILFIYCNVYGQHQYSISGIISNQDNGPLNSGDILLMDKKDNTTIGYAIVNQGKFSFTNLEIGAYILSISCIGYEKKIEEILLNKNKSITITLQKSRVALDEVTIKGIKNNIKFTNGNIKVEIENSVFKSLPTTTAVLSKLPGIQISPNQESISIIGRGTPLLYLDNQKINFDQLKALAVDDIKDIEIIDNPSAKYEAEGRSLILITRKRDILDGYKVQLSETASFKRRFDNYAGLNSTFKKKQLELRANFNYNQIGFWEAVDSKLDIPDENIKSQISVNSIGPRPQFVMGSGVFYSLNKNDYISGQVNFRTQTDRFPILASTFLQQDLQEDFILTETKNDEERSFFSSNINLNKKITNTSNLFFGIQYSSYVRHLKSNIFNNLNQMGFVASQNRDQKYQIEALATRIDLEKEFDKNVKLEIGGSISHANALATSDFNFLRPISKRTSKYDYQEDIYASYAELSAKKNKYNFSLGIRSETNVVKGSFRKESNPLIDRKKTRLFPKVKFTIPIDSTKSLHLNYNTTISRPSFLNASSISTFISPFSEFSRNVNLKPTITTEISANIQLKKHSLYLNYYTEKDPIFYAVRYTPSENRTISSPQNFSEESGYQIRYTNTTTYKLWSTTNSLSVLNSKIKDDLAILNKVKPYLYYYSNNEFKLPHETTLGLNFWGFTKRYQGVFKRNAMFVLGASFTKIFFKDLTVAINVNDVFRNMNFIDVSTINSINTENIYYVNAQELSISIKYFFGKVKKTSFKNKDIDENINRLR
ncbi:TonB-dependent receptor [Aquimarina sp. AD10]|uniref:outer membrane beta-barrel family protein n=1 Tax=Aquimarina sp. AD10 TaxID=1714849 RepID=UPI000E4DB042|nr:outer membrane beta-barrel family protein [Aquimarina sp. AD10]AXT60666.1 TonB-dependent receptor [Aquimarina sp. AD10]RKN01758.1 TonB-dependent receptor [Aquimarina sp. AD10]